MSLGYPGFAWKIGLQKKSMMENRLTYGYYMVNIWLMMVNNNLVGGAITILKNMSSSMGRMTSPILWKIKNLWNRQPVMDSLHKNMATKKGGWSQTSSGLKPLRFWKSTTVFGTTSRKYETHRGLHLTMFPCFCVHEWSWFLFETHPYVYNLVIVCASIELLHVYTAR